VSPCAGYCARCHGAVERSKMGRRGSAKLVPPRPRGAPRFRDLWPVWGSLIALVWVAFSPVLTSGFVDWDDPHCILDNDSFRGLGWEQIHFAFTTLRGGVYQPLGWLLQSLTYEFSGLDPLGYHVAGLLLHMLNVVLLHLLCVSLLATRMAEAAKLSRT